MNFNIHDKILHTLHKAENALLELRDEWFIFGSAASVLSGVRIEKTNDIDILTSERDAKLLKKLWHSRDLHIDSKPSELFRSDFSRYRFDLIDIEICGNLEIYRNNKWQPVTIFDYETLAIGKLLIKIPTLHEQKNILQLFGREKDLEKIKLVEKRLEEIGLK